MAWFRNFYKCADCGRKWTDDWSATCDDDCPHCGARHMSPYKSTDAGRPRETSAIASNRGNIVETDASVDDDEPTPALFRNFYICENCDSTWTDVWSAMCDDDCPHCGARHMSPFKSEDVDDTEGEQESDPS